MPDHLRPSTPMLWVLVVVIAAVITGVSLWPRDSPRSDVAGYITRANAAGARFASQYGAVSTAYRRLSLAPRDRAGQLDRLREAARQLTILRRELQGLPAPPAARTLRLRLIAFYRLQEQVGHELAAIVAYFPRLASAESAVRPAGEAMRKALPGARTPQAQAEVLTAYAHVVQRAADNVEHVPAPALLRDARAEEAARLRKTARSLDGVIAGLRAHDRARLKKAVAAIGVTSDAAARATRAAILAYDAHIVRIRQLGALVEKERRRLESSLG